MYKVERVFVDTRKRKRRTSLEGSVRTALESYFLKCPKPNTLEITHISDDLGLERDVREPDFCCWLSIFWLCLCSFCDTACVCFRWCACGSVTADRKARGWPCPSTKKALRVSTTIRAQHHPHTWAAQPSRVRVTQDQVTPAACQRCTCHLFIDQRSSNRPCILD